MSETVTIATLADGSTIERETSTRLVKWWLVAKDKRSLLDLVTSAASQMQVDVTEAFILRRFAVGAQIHPV